LREFAIAVLGALFIWGVPIPALVPVEREAGDESLYETGRIDVVGVSLPYIERASDQSGPFAGQLAQSPELSVTYLGFNSAEPPFDDVNIRLAFSYAIDKDTLVSVTFKNMVQRSDGILPPGMPGYNKNLTGLNFDVNKAKDLIAKSKYGSVANLPPITLTTSGEGGGVSSFLEALVYQWKQNLGVDVTIRVLEPERYIYNLKSELDQMFDFGWIADYPHLKVRASQVLQSLAKWAGSPA